MPEIQKGTNSLNNNKSAGADNVTAKLLKNAPDIIPSQIALIYNNIATTGKHPRE